MRVEVSEEEEPRELLEWAEESRFTSGNNLRAEPILYPTRDASRHQSSTLDSIPSVILV